MVSDSWKAVNLGNLVDITHGFAFKGEFFCDNPPGDILLTPGNFAVGGGFKTDKFKYYVGSVPEEFVLKKGDLLVTMTDLSKAGDTLGYPAILPAPPRGSRYLHNQRLGKVIILPHAPVRKDFLYYLFQIELYRNEVLASATGTTVKHTSPRRIKAFSFFLPPEEEQQAIAHILGTLDDKIELNQQMNQNLEAITQAIFKSWFVDFDPVRAKMEGRQPAGMDAATAALFPDLLEDLQVGETPKEWEIKPLDEVANFLNGLALQKYPPTGNEYLPVIKIAELRKGVTESSGRASPNIDNRYIIADGEVLFSWSGSLEVCVWCGGKGALNQHLFKVTSADYPKWFYYQWLKYYLPDFQAIAASKATTMGHIQRHHLSEAQAVVPPADTLQIMDKTMAPLLNRVISNSIESHTLTAIRDSLLLKLMSGEIRVKDAEKLVEAAA